MKSPIRILLVEDSDKDAELISETLDSEEISADINRVQTREAFLAALERGEFDIILSDYNLPSFDGLTALALTRERASEMPFILVSGTLGEDVAIESMKSGASDYVMKHRLARLGPAVRRALKEAENEKERKRAERALQIRNAQFSRLMESNIVGIVFADTEGAITEANEGYLRMVGATAEDVKAGKVRWDTITPPEFAPITQKMRAQVLDEGSCTPTETEIIRSDGSRAVLLVGSALLEGTAKDSICVVLDISERKRAEEQIKRQLENIGALRKIDMAITGSLDLRIMLSVIIDQVVSQLKIDAAAVLLFHQSSQTLEWGDGRGFRTNALKHTHLQLGDGYAGQCAATRSLVQITNLRAAFPAFKRSKEIGGEDFVAYFAVPLISKGQVRGVLELFHRSVITTDEEWLDLLNILAGQVAIAIDNAGLFDDLQRSNADLVLAYDKTLEGWSNALDLRDKETEGHTERVTELTLRLARSMRLSNGELAHIRRGALLHDIGKLGIPDGILLKEGPLTDEEWVIMRRHPVYAYEWLYPIPFLRPALDIPYCHHEKWDGTGYPRGLRKESIPMAARIFAIVDVWDALTSDRPYRKAWPKEKVLGHIRSLVGTHFDPEIAEAFFALEL